jgi:beta-lactamase regulating signal transducer with metallopeptidase domain
MLWWLAQNTVSASILALLVLLVCRFCSLRPSLRHALWLVVLVKLVAPPLVLWPWNPLQLVGLSSPDKAPETIDLAQLQVVNLVEADPSTRESLVYKFALPGAVLEESASSVPVVAPSLLERLAFLQPWILGLWLTGAGGMFVVQVVRAGRFRRLMRGWRPAPRRLRHQVARLSREMKLRSPRCLVLPGLHSPFIWSLVRPWLIWPAPLHDHLSPEAHRTVIVHELAHLRRRDHWVGWLQLAGECLFWWNPLFWFVRRQIRFQAELACDAWVMRLLPGARRAYAEALIEVTALISRAPAPVPALGMSSAARQDFERRLTMIMNDKVPGKAPLLGVAAIGLLGLAVLPGFAQNSQAPANAPSIEIVSDGFNQLDAHAVQQGQARNDTEARLDSLIGELDSLIQQVNVGQANGKDESKKSGSDQELKLIEAVELAYSDALLLKADDDSQSEISREEKIKQIEKKLQALLKEVQSLKGEGGARIAAPKTVRQAVVRPVKPGADKKPEAGKTMMLELKLEDGQLEKLHNLHLNLGDLKLNAGKPGEGHPLVLHYDGPGKSQILNLSPAHKPDGAHEIKLEVRKSEDGKSLIINGKPHPLPKPGEAKQLRLEGKDGNSVIIINVDEHHAKGPDEKKKTATGTANVIFELKGDMLNKTDAKPHVFKSITTEKSDEGTPHQFFRIITDEKEKGGKPHVFKIISDETEKDGKPHVFKIISDETEKDGKPHVFNFTSPSEHGTAKTVTGVFSESKIEGQDGKRVNVIVETPSISKTVISGTKNEKTGVWTTVAPKQSVTVKSEDGKNFAIWSVNPEKTATGKPGEGKVQAWTVVESDGKAHAHAHSVGVYKLPKGKAAAIAGFLKENAKGSAVETTVEGDTLTVKGSPEAIKAIASMISLMQGKPAVEGKKAQPQQLKYELKLIPSGKDTSMKGSDTKSFVDWSGIKLDFSQNFAKSSGERTGFADFRSNVKGSAEPFRFEGKVIENKGLLKP